MREEPALIEKMENSPGEREMAVEGSEWNGRMAQCLRKLHNIYLIFDDPSHRTVLDDLRVEIRSRIHNLAPRDSFSRLAADGDDDNSLERERNDDNNVPGKKDKKYAVEESENNECIKDLLPRSSGSKLKSRAAEPSNQQSGQSQSGADLPPRRGGMSESLVNGYEKQDEFYKEPEDARQRRAAVLDASARTGVPFSGVPSSTFESILMSYNLDTISSEAVCQAGVRTGASEKPASPMPLSRSSRNDSIMMPDNFDSIIVSFRNDSIMLLDDFESILASSIRSPVKRDDPVTLFVSSNSSIIMPDADDLGSVTADGESSPIEASASCGKSDLVPGAVLVTDPLPEPKVAKVKRGALSTYPHPASANHHGLTSVADMQTSLVFPPNPVTHPRIAVLGKTPQSPLISPGGPLAHSTVSGFGKEPHSTTPHPVLVTQPRIDADGKRMSSIFPIADHPNFSSLLPPQRVRNNLQEGYAPRVHSVPASTKIRQ